MIKLKAAGIQIAKEIKTIDINKQLAVFLRKSILHIRTVCSPMVGWSGLGDPEDNDCNFYFIFTSVHKENIICRCCNAYISSIMSIIELTDLSVTYE